MKLQDLEHLQTYTLPVTQAIHRVQRIRACPETTVIGPLKMAPVGSMLGRFDVENIAVGYFAESATTACYESAVRREATFLSLKLLRSRQLLTLRTKRSLALLDLRPLASEFPGLQANRIEVTQELAAEAYDQGYDGLTYRSAQHYGKDCYAVFGPALKSLRLESRARLVMPDGSMHKALFDAIRGGQISVTD